MGSYSERTTTEHKFELSSTIVSRFLTQQNSGQFNLSKLRGRPFDFWGGRGEWVISEKKIPADWFRVRKDFCKQITDKKSYTVVCRGKKFHHQRSGGTKILLKPNRPYPPSKVKWSAPKSTFFSFDISWSFVRVIICHDSLSNPCPIKVSLT